MNVERINAVADAIEQHTIPWLGFNMWNYLSDAAQMEYSGLKDHTEHNCNTVACIAGWTNAVRYNVSRADRDTFIDDSGAADWLGLSYLDEENSQANDLFYAHNHPAYAEHGIEAWKDITAEQAVRTLRHLAATGVVDWTV